jgi:hypothetical protein
MGEYTPRMGDAEGTEPPGTDEDASAHMNELREYKEKQKEWNISDGVQNHPLFWFVWEDTPGTDNASFLAHLSDILGLPWILEAAIEKSSDELSMIVTKDDDLVYLELRRDLHGVVVSDRTGNLAEVTARESEGKTSCFSKIVCNYRMNTEYCCLRETVPGSLKCQKHLSCEGKPGPKTLNIPMLRTGVGALPTNTYYYLKQHEPETARFIDDMIESFRLKLSWDIDHPLMNELRYIAVQMITRDRMHTRAIAADFKSAIHDPETGQVVAFKAHYLLDKVTTFDARIQQKLKDFGLLVPPSRTEDPQRIPIELELLWTPIKKVNAIEVSARHVKQQEQHDQIDHGDNEVEKET